MCSVNCLAKLIEQHDALLKRNIARALANAIDATLKMNECYGEPLSPFYDTFKSPLKKEKMHYMKPRFSVDQVQAFWFKGGYPEAIGGSELFYREWMSAYEATYIHRDIAKLFPKLDKVAYRRFLTMLAKLSSKLINKSNVARSIGVTEPTVRDYIDIAAETFLWRTLPSFENSATKSILKMPRGHIRYSGLLHHLLRIHSLESLQSDPIAGFSFEAFVIKEVLKGLQDARVRDVDVYYY